MKKSERFWRFITLIIAPISIGLANIILIKPEDVGNWKSYFGYALLLLGLVNLVLFVINLKKAQK